MSNYSMTLGRNSEMRSTLPMKKTLQLQRGFEPDATSNSIQFHIMGAAA